MSTQVTPLQPQAPIGTPRSPGSNLRLQIGLAGISGLVLGILLWQISPVWILALLSALFGAVVLWRGWPRAPLALLILCSFLQHVSLNGAQEASQSSLNIRPEQAAALGIGLMLMLWTLLQRKPFIITLPGACAIAWWMINLVAALMNAPYWLDSLKHVLRLSLMVTTFLAVLNLIPDRRTWRLAVLLLLGLGTLEDIYGIVARVLYPGINLGVQFWENLGHPVPYGTFDEGNLFGSHTAAWLLALLALAAYGFRLSSSNARSSASDLSTHPDPQPTPRLSLYFFAILIAAVSLIISYARGAWVGFAVGAVALFVWESPNASSRALRTRILLVSLPIMALLLALTIAFAPASLPFVERLRSFTRLSTDQTFGARVEDLSLAAFDWSERPFIGWGPGTYFQLHGYIRYNPAWIANLSVRTLQESGILGGLAFAGLALLPLIWAVRSVRSEPDSFARAATVGLATGWVTLLVAYQATDGFWLAAPWVHLAIMTAGVRLRAGVGRNEENDER